MSMMTRRFSVFLVAIFLVSVFGGFLVFADESMSSLLMNKGEKDISLSSEQKENNNASIYEKRIRIRNEVLRERSERIRSEMEDKRDLLRTIFNNLTPEQKRILLLMHKEELLEIIKEGNPDEIREKIEEKMKKREELEKKGWKRRVVAFKEKEKRLNKIKERLKRVRMKIKEHREIERELRELKREYRECLEANQTTQDEICEQKREAFINKSKEYLLNAINVTIENLEAVKDKVETSEYLNETQIQTIVERIDNEIAIFESIKAKVLSCEDLSCLRESAEDLKRNLTRIKLSIRLRLLEEEGERIGLIEERANAILARLELLMERARANNISQDKLEQLETIVNEIRSDIETARAKKEESQDYFEKAKDAFREGSIEEGRTYLEMSKDALEEAKDALKEANKKLQKIWNYIKDKKRLRILLVEKTDALESEVEEKSEVKAPETE